MIMTKMPGRSQQWSCRPVLNLILSTVKPAIRVRQHSQSQSPNHVIFSGIQPTGVPHLGNYLGALQQWVKQQDSAAPTTKLFYSIVDLHAITVPQDPLKLRRWKRETLATLIAIGLDPNRSTLFYQSSVQAHSELMWILSCTASMGYLSRMTQWKSKRSALDNKLGLFSYPVLQAADVLVHRATHVPVGEDQSQHLEFTRECATNFNHAHGRHLVVPKTILSPTKRVMSLQDPSLKMSKSHLDPRSRILLTDSPEEIHRKVMSALTDSTNFVSYEPTARPALANLLQLLSCFDPEGMTPESLAVLHNSRSLKDFKFLLSNKISSSLSNIRSRYIELMAEQNGQYLDHVEELGRRKANESAESTMAVVRGAVGF